MLTFPHLVKKFPTFYGTRRFITAFTSVHQLSLSWASSIRSVPPHSTSWRSILILSSHLQSRTSPNFYLRIEQTFTHVGTLLLQQHNKFHILRFYGTPEARKCLDKSTSRLLFRRRARCLLYFWLGACYTSGSVSVKLLARCLLHF